jgi:hypothetical protein
MIFGRLSATRPEQGRRFQQQYPAGQGPLLPAQADGAVVMTNNGAPPDGGPGPGREAPLPPRSESVGWSADMRC